MRMRVTKAGKVIKSATSAEVVWRYAVMIRSVSCDAVMIRSVSRDAVMIRSVFDLCLALRSHDSLCIFKSTLSFSFSHTFVSVSKVSTVSLAYRGNLD